MKRFIWLGFSGDLFYWKQHFWNGFSNPYTAWRIGPFSVRVYDKKF